MSVRHPKILQMYGAASVGNIHATLFHGDLIPFEAFLNLNRHSHSSTVKIYANCRIEFTEASLFVHSVTKKTLAAWDCTRWIRPTTGSLCVDFVSPSNDLYFQSGIPGVCSVKAPHTAELVDSLELRQYHEICRWDLSQYRRRPVTLTAVSLGSVVDCRSSGWGQDAVEVASLSYTPFRWGAWSTHRGAAGHVMDDGWTRFNCGEIVGDTIQLHVQAKHSVGHAWLCQANHIFDRLRISSNFKDYAIVHHIHFELKISGTRMVPHPGFLFLCPKKDCRTGSSSFFWPEYSPKLGSATNIEAQHVCFGCSVTSSMHRILYKHTTGSPHEAYTKIWAKSRREDREKAMFVWRVK
ncbi:hypothetical protein DFH06DRAFT_510453 [Mycena polygramma]|nr:hypothetical protein DFH06DRAFT_510453 [Mycena polygramma]